MESILGNSAVTNAATRASVGTMMHSRHFRRAQVSHFLLCDVLPLSIALFAPFWLPANWLSWHGVVIAVGMWVLVGGIGVSVGLHRHFSHRAFAASAPLRVLMGVAGSMAAQGPLLYWVAIHRCHHAFSDRQGDPHSPSCIANNESNRILSFFRSHMLWAWRHDVPMPSRYTPDLLKDRLACGISKRYWSFVALGIVLPSGIGGLVFQSTDGMLIGAYWGGFFRIAFGHQIIWSINSVCHVFGSRSYDTGDDSRNNAVLAILSFGEGWHNNHHHAPTATNFSHCWWQLDSGWLFIKACEALGLTEDVRQRLPVKLDLE